MFDQIIGEKTARKPFAMAVSVSGQAVVLGIAILVPLLHTKAITTGRLCTLCRSSLGAGNGLSERGRRATIRWRRAESRYSARRP